MTSALEVSLARLRWRLRHALRPQRAAGRTEWAFIQDSDTWSPNTICRRIAERLNVDSAQVQYEEPMFWPDATVYFFAHFSFFRTFLRSHPHPEKKRTLVFFTHYAFAPGGEDAVVRDLRAADVVFAVSTSWRDWLVAHGLDAAKIVVVLLGTDASVFTAGRSTRPTVGFCGGYQERKDPDLMWKLVESMPDVDFILLGRNWEQHAGFAGVSWRPNFRYSITAYDRYAAVYHQMRVFVNTTRLDGGPLGLLEAMMCDVLPVSTTVGFAPDIIEHGQNGLLFEPGASLTDVVALVRRALATDLPVRPSVLHLTWERFADLVIASA